MSQPFKTRGWRQGLREVSTTAKHNPGDLRVEQNGDCYRYTYCLGALTAGQAAMQPVHEVDFDLQETTSAIPVGAQSISVPITNPETAYAANAFASKE